MDLVTAIELIEDTDGTVCWEVVQEAWQYLVDSGAIHHLQGSYQHWAEVMIWQGYLKPPGA